MPSTWCIASVRDWQNVRGYSRMQIMMPDAQMRAAATVLLLEDSADGMRVLVVVRSAGSPAFAGFTAFPGGKVDISDTTSATIVHTALLALAAPTRFEDAAQRRCALRELYEETGVGVSQQSQDALAALHALSRWRSPAGEAARFDTMFYLMRAPSAITLKPCRTEVDAVAFIAPAELLARYTNKEIRLAPPTHQTLLWLATFANASAAIAAVASAPPPAYEPVTQLEHGMRFVQMPWHNEPTTLSAQRLGAGDDTAPTRYLLGAEGPVPLPRPQRSEPRIAAR
jgi:8-oxo-dGTP pyrophosphatase MutT (NUDIX family)